MRPGFFLKEAFRALSRNAAPSLAAMLTVLLTALVLGVFIPIVQATTGTANEVRSRVVVDVYVSDSATNDETAELRQALMSTPNVQSVEFISKGEALARAEEKNPKAFREGAELLGSNPLPASFRVTPEDPNRIREIVADLAALRREAGRDPTEPYDVVVALPPDSDPTPYGAVGATWWLVEFPWDTLSVDQVRDVIRDGPAAPA
jgi:cell division transport system permease protein